MSAAQRRPITRNREMLACVECRRRKLKCDRESPCSSCVKRDDEGSCVYQRYARGTWNERERRIEAETRLVHLEQLVQQLAQRGNNGRPNESSETSVSATSGSLNKSQTNGASESSLPTTAKNGSPENGSWTRTLSLNGEYNGSTHWSAMLQDIEGLRHAMGGDNAATDTSSSTGSAVDILFGAGGTPSFSQVLEQWLPSRQEADRLTAAYFRSKAIAAPFLHTSQFRRQYQLFWQDPSNAPPLWTSILFTVCHIAKNNLTSSGHGAATDSNYSIAAAQCLVIGKYFQPQKLVVEALVLFTQARLFSELDIPADVATLLSVVIRLATKMGYHRDPEKFAISAFDREIRRRTWTLCLQLDLLTAFQFGIPSIVQYPTWDTKPPSNLSDSDFDEEIQFLPPPRPDSEITDITFYITKHKLVVVFEKILRHSLATDEDGAGDVDKLDAEIFNAYHSLPEILHPRPMTESVVDSPWLTVTRLCVAFQVYKCRCVLHRKYVAQGRIHSIRSCHESSRALVRTFLDAYDEFQPGGQLESERWFLSSITWHDYLLGAVALCLVACTQSQDDRGVEMDRSETLELLRKCHGVCLEQSWRNPVNTKRAMRVIGATASFLEGQISQTWAGQASQINSFGMSTTQITNRGSAQQTMQPGSEIPADTVGTHQSAWDQDLLGAMGDPSWLYLEQFLNLPIDEFMVDL